MAVKAPSTKATKTTKAPTFEEIAARSYELYLARGQQDGHDVEDWLAAESQLNAESR